MTSPALSVYHSTPTVNVADKTTVQPQKSTHQELRNLATQLLNYGESLSDPKHAKNFLGSPDSLENKTLLIIGEGCRMINAGLQVKDKINSILSDQLPINEKAKCVADVAHLTLQFAKSPLVSYLPKRIQSNIKWIYNAYETIRSTVSRLETQKNGTRSELGLGHGLGHEKNTFVT